MASGLVVPEEAGPGSELAERASGLVVPEDAGPGSDLVELDETSDMLIDARDATADDVPILKKDDT